MNLGDWRSRVDDLDDQILNLLNQRAEAALHTGDLKRRQDAPSYVPEREAEILRRLAADNRGPLGTAAARTMLAGGPYGVPLLRARVEDHPHNSTSSPIGSEAAGPTGRDKTSVLFPMRNEPGAPHRILEPLAEMGERTPWLRVLGSYPAA